MKYSISYNSDISLRKAADEIRVPFNKLGYIYEFMTNHPEKQYVIIVDSILTNFDNQLKLVTAVLQDNYTIECKTIDIIKYVKNKGYNCFYAYSATDWETFNNLLNLQVSDIYIDGPICFDISALEKIKKTNNINIRVRPNISTNAFLGNNLTSLNSFFIRPEDLNLYESAIDTIVFDKETSLLKEETLFKIYKKEQYAGNLKDIVFQLDTDINNLHFPQSFGKYRTNCKQKCKAGERCRYCFTVDKLVSKIFY